MLTRIMRFFARRTPSHDTAPVARAPSHWQPALAPRDARVAAALMTFTNN